MKAIIDTNDNLDGFRLKLLAEGANDRTLLRMLEQRQPLVRRLTHETLEIPIASPEMFRLPALDELTITSASADLPGTRQGLRIRVSSDPWQGAPLMGARLHVSEPDRWDIRELIVNGKTRSLLDPLDIYPGTVVELEAELTGQAFGQAFRATLRKAGQVTPADGKTEPSL